MQAQHPRKEKGVGKTKIRYEKRMFQVRILRPPLLQSKGRTLWRTRGAKNSWVRVQLVSEPLPPQKASVFSTRLKASFGNSPWKWDEADQPHAMCWKITKSFFFHTVSLMKKTHGLLF
ncbi:unnamed protein product [Larinioides sclopetarius]|uniref:Uncharacterized protein n=1 Tax=Larinioides sclopetarius TaxID=280406 RepID=A0AAV2AHV3_9ARAC